MGVAEVRGDGDLDVAVLRLAADAPPVHYPVLACLEVAGLLFVGLTAGSLALNLNAGHQALPDFGER